jgi:hypothetical protein
MCAAYVAAGLPPERFWTLTPRLYMIEMRGAADRLERQRRERIEDAWLVATLGRAKRIPSLDRLLAPVPKRGRKMSTEEKQAMFDAMAAKFGATMQ